MVMRYMGGILYNLSHEWRNNEPSTVSKQIDDKKRGSIRPSASPIRRDASASRRNEERGVSPLQTGRMLKDGVL